MMRYLQSWLPGSVHYREGILVLLPWEVEAFTAVSGRKCSASIWIFLHPGVVFSSLLSFKPFPSLPPMCPLSWYLFHKAPSFLLLKRLYSEHQPFLFAWYKRPSQSHLSVFPCKFYVEKCLLNHLAEVIEYLLCLLTTKTMLSWADVNWSAWSGRIGQATRGPIACLLKGAHSENVLYSSDTLARRAASFLAGLTL